MVVKVTSSQQAIEWEDKYGAHNYQPLGVVIARGKVTIWNRREKVL